MLSSRGGDSTLQIVETNDFKQLPHISLAFRPGNDAAVKQARREPLAPAETPSSHVQGASDDLLSSKHSF